MNTPKCETEYEFTFVLDGINDTSTEFEDALFEAGCDDATISVRLGRVYLTFARKSYSLKDAIISAIRDVRSSNCGAFILRIDECDLVTQSEIARRIDRTRQLVNQYISGDRGPGGFPPPACNITDGQPLWLWCEVAYWLSENDMIAPEAMRDAQELAIINHVLELEHQRHLYPELTKEITDALSLCRTD